MDLVNEQQVSVGADAELVLRVGEHESRSLGNRPTALEELHGDVHHLVPHGAVDESLRHDIGRGDRLVVAAVVSLRRRRHDRGGQLLMSGHPVGEAAAVHRPFAVAVAAEQRGGGGPGEATAHDYLDRQGLRVDRYQRVGVGLRERVVGDDVGRLSEPPHGELVEHLTLVAHRSEHPVEGREPVGGDEQPPAAG